MPVQRMWDTHFSKQTKGYRGGKLTKAIGRFGVQNVTYI